MSEKKPIFMLATPTKVRCLRCDKPFLSPDKNRIRLCKRCRGKKPSIWVLRREKEPKKPLFDCVKPIVRQLSSTKGWSIVNGNDRILEWHELWREQCRAADDIEERYGRRRALDYIVGEKFVNHLNASNFYPELARETPKFVAEIRSMYEPWEIADYLKAADSKAVPIDDDYELDHRDRKLIVEEAERIVLLERTRKLLIG